MNKPEPLPYFDLVRWLTRLKHYDAGGRDSEHWRATTLGEAMEAALSDQNRDYASELYRTVNNPFFYDAYIPEFLDVLVDPEWNDLVMEQLASLQFYQRYLKTHEPIVLKQA